jgi:hypothetical protein
MLCCLPRSQTTADRHRSDVPEALHKSPATGGGRSEEFVYVDTQPPPTPCISSPLSRPHPPADLRPPSAASLQHNRSMVPEAPHNPRASLDHSTQHTATHPEPTSECCRAKLLEVCCTERCSWSCFVMLNISIVRQAKFILQKLAGLSSTPTIALNEAAEFICQYLGVALVRYGTASP